MQHLELRRKNRHVRTGQEPVAGDVIVDSFPECDRG